MQHRLHASSGRPGQGLLSPSGHAAAPAAGRPGRQPGRSLGEGAPRCTTTSRSWFAWSWSVSAAATGAQPGREALPGAAEAFFVPQELFQTAAGPGRGNGNVVASRSSPRSPHLASHPRPARAFRGTGSAGGPLRAVPAAPSRRPVRGRRLCLPSDGSTPRVHPAARPRGRAPRKRRKCRLASSSRSTSTRAFGGLRGPHTRSCCALAVSEAELERKVGGRIEMTWTPRPGCRDRLPGSAEITDLTPTGASPSPRPRRRARSTGRRAGRRASASASTALRHGGFADDPAGRRSATAMPGLAGLPAVLRSLLEDDRATPAAGHDARDLPSPQDRAA